RRKAGRERLVAEKHGDAVRTFAEAFAAWDKQLDRAVGVSTADRYRCSLAQIAPWLEGRTLPEINGRLVAEIIEGRQAASVKNATIKRDLGALSSVMKFCILKDWREDNPVLAKLALIPERRDPIVLPLERDIKLVAEHIGKTAPAVANLIWAACKTGAREAELIRSLRDHIDHERRQMTLIGKRNKLRVIDLEPFGGYAFVSGLPARLKCKWLFWNRDGKPYSLSSFAGNFSATVKDLAALAKKEGIEFTPFTFHHLRHWHAVHYLKNGYGTIYDLQGRLGHTSVKTTEVYLAYLTPEEVQAAKYGRGAGPQKEPQKAAGATA
ncbi:MAG TPA: tyrosine-type recombinase/integrase, partial [Pseudolabrys sp.]|nr:tyrosine-type recombinase/integrase [Pseudolabrys sp.]